MTQTLYRVTDKGIENITIEDGQNKEMVLNMYDDEPIFEDFNQAVAFTLQSITDRLDELERKK